MMLSTRRLLLYLTTLLVVKSSSGFIVATPPSSRRPQLSDTALFGLARKMARRFGKLVGESEWKKIPESFQEGLEESEINARARNAKPMEPLPEELPSTLSDESTSEALDDTKEKIIVDVGMHMQTSFNISSAFNCAKQ